MSGSGDRLEKEVTRPRLATVAMRLTSEGRDKWRVALAKEMEQGRLRTSEYAIGVVISDRLNWKKGRAYGGAGHIAKTMGMAALKRKDVTDPKGHGDNRSVRKATARMIALGFLRPFRGGDGAPQEFELVMPVGVPITLGLELHGDDAPKLRPERRNDADQKIECGEAAPRPDRHHDVVQSGPVAPPTYREINLPSLSEVDGRAAHPRCDRPLERMEKKEAQQTEQVKSGCHTFVGFCAVFPFHNGMSAGKAKEEFDRLDDSDRRKAIIAAERYGNWVRSRGQDNPLHAHTWLHRREFDFSPPSGSSVAAGPTKRTYVSVNAPHWHRLAEHYRAKHGVYPYTSVGPDGSMGWGFTDDDIAAAGVSL